MLKRIQVSWKGSNGLSQESDHWSHYEFPNCQIYCPRLECGQELQGWIKTANQKIISYFSFFFLLRIFFKSLDIYFSVLLCFLSKVKGKNGSSPLSFPSYISPLPSCSKTTLSADQMASHVLWVHFYCKSLWSEPRPNQDPHKSQLRLFSDATCRELCL